MNIIVCGDQQDMCHVGEDPYEGLPLEMVEGIASGVAYRWNRHNTHTVDPEDVRQEAWLAYFENRKEIDRHLAGDRREDARRIIRDHVWRYCRRERAAQCGYDPEDDWYYPLGTLRRLLPAAFGGDVAQEGGASAEPRRKPQGGTTSGSDPDTMAVDVRWGLSQMSTYDRHLLFDVYGQPRGETTRPDYGRAKAALVRLQQVLGGPPH